MVREIAGGVFLSYVCFHCRSFPFEDYIWWVSSGHGDGNRKKEQCNSWCAACGGQYDWRAPNRVLVMQDSVGFERQKYFEHRHRRKECAII